MSRSGAAACLPCSLTSARSLKRLQRDLRSTGGGLQITTADPRRYGGVDHPACIVWPTADKGSLARRKRCTKCACLRTRSRRVLLTRLGAYIYTHYIYMPVLVVLVRVITAAGGRRWAPQCRRSILSSRARCVQCARVNSNQSRSCQQSASARAESEANSQASTTRLNWTGLDSSGLFPKG